MHKAAQAYVQTQVTTTSQGDILLLLYDGAIKFLKQAKVHIEERDYAKKGILISKALDVISELDGCLNSQKGGDLAENLHKLYFYCNTKLLQANLKLNIQYIDEVITILASLRQAFADVANTPEAMQAQTETTHAPNKPKPQAPSPSPAPSGQATESQAFNIYGRGGSTPILNAVPKPDSAFRRTTTNLQMNGASAYRRIAENNET